MKRPKPFGYNGTMKEGIMKSRCRQAFALLITAITVTLTGCSIFDKTANDEYISPSKQAENNLVTIVEAINKQDSYAIKQLLSSHLVSNHEDIDSRIDEMINFIDGEIISYDEPFGSACGGFEKDTGAKIQCLLTDMERSFTLQLSNGIVMTSNLNRLGYTTSL